jgi:hypothetical protein
MFARLAVSEKRCSGLLALTCAITLVAGLTLLSGCTQVMGFNSPYYKNGPAQREGPQGTIPAGTRVWVLGKEGSYAHVWTANGVDGYVWDTSIVSNDEWNRRQAIEKQNQEVERRARAKGAGPLGLPEQEPASSPPTPPRSSGGGWPGK